MMSKEEKYQHPKAVPADGKIKAGALQPPTKAGALQPPTKAGGVTATTAPAVPSRNRVKSEKSTKPNAHIPEISKLMEVLRIDTKSNSCEAAGCTKPCEVICRICDRTLCYKCSKSLCSENPGQKHQANDFDESLEGSKKLYSLWLTGKKNKVVELDRQKKETCLLIKKTSLELANSPLAAVLDLTARSVSTLTEKLGVLKALAREHAETEEINQYYKSNASDLSDIALVKLTRSLTIPDEYEECRGYSIGDYITLLSRACEYITTSPDGIILASTLNSVSMFKMNSAQEIGTVPLGGHVCGFQSYDTRLFVAIEIPNRGDKIVVFDKQYVQTSQWMVNYKVCDLAVSDNQVYVSESSVDCKIHVYTPIGTELYVITEGAGQRIACHAIPNLIIVTNHSDDKVFGLDGRNRKILWTAEVEKPWGAFVDEFESIWVWSEYHQGFFIYNDKGNELQEVSHPKLTGIGDVNSVCIVDGTLWVGFDGGLHKFQLGYC